MSIALKIFTNYEYKKLFLRSISLHNLYNDHNLQLYRIQDYLKDILIPVIPYRTTFNFVLFVTQGHVLQQVDNFTYNIKAGQCLTVNQGTVTATLALSSDVEGYIAIYENDILTNFLLTYDKSRQFNYNPFISLQNYDVQALLGSFILLEEELKHNQHRTPVYLHLFFSILSRIAYNTIEEPVWLSRDLEISFKFKTLVQEHHIAHKSVIFYANQLSISENYLNKCIRRTTGKSTKQWINETNIQYSQILLRDSHRDVAQIAYDLNFQSPSYFARLFKKISGQTPTEFRMSTVNRLN